MSGWGNEEPGNFIHIILLLFVTCHFSSSFKKKIGGSCSWYYYTTHISQITKVHTYSHTCKNQHLPSISGDILSGTGLKSFASLKPMRFFTAYRKHTNSYQTLTHYIMQRNVTYFLDHTQHTNFNDLIWTTCIHKGFMLSIHISTLLFSISCFSRSQLK